MNNLLTVVIGVVIKGDQVLIGRKIQVEEFLSEKWHMPGGKMLDDADEFIATAREVKEESGIDVEVKRFLGEKVEEDRGIILKWYECKPLTFELLAGDDMAEVKFVDRSEVLELVDPSVIAQWPGTVKDFIINA